MATLTPAQIATVARSAGFSGDALAWAVAVALAESGGRSDAVGVNNDQWRSRDRGLWQINNHWHPEVSDAAAFSPGTAAAAAYRISSGGKSWAPWATYKNGSAAAQLSRARMAVEQTGGSSSTGTPSTGTGDVATGTAGAPDQGLLDQLGGMAKSVAAIASTWIKAAEWIANPHNWVRILEVGGGAVLIIIAVNMMGRTGAGPVADAIAVPGKAKRAVVKAII